MRWLSRFGGGRRGTPESWLRLYGGGRGGETTHTRAISPCRRSFGPLVSGDMEGELGPGRVLAGKYRIDGVLGRGGMGLVLQVTHLQLGEQLALKVLSSEGVATPELHARFLREAQAAVRLRGEHVARVSDVGVLPDGAPYMVMEYLRGTDLAGEIARRGVLHPGEAVDHVLQACEALAEAHAHGIVHRDVKPADMFFLHRPPPAPLASLFFLSV